MFQSGYYYAQATAISGLTLSSSGITAERVNATNLYVAYIDGLDGGVTIAKLKVQSGDSFPDSPVADQVFFRNDTDKLYVYDGGWELVGTTAYGDLSGTPTTWDYGDLTNTPDLTVYLTKDGARALTGSWNAGGSYGIYGLTFLNATTLYVSTIDALNGDAGVQVMKFIVECGDDFPSDTLREGRMFYRNDTGNLYFYNATAADWVAVGNGTGGVTSYDDLTDKPDLTVYLTHDGLTALSGDWNIGGSYGVYAATWLNGTSVNADTFYQLGVQLGFVTPYTYIIDVSSNTYRLWYGANSTLAWSSTNTSAVFNAASGNATAVKGSIFVKAGDYSFTNPILPSNNTVWIGEGIGSHLFVASSRPNGNGDEFYWQIFWSYAADLVENVTISNLNLDGNYANNNDVGSITGGIAVIGLYGSTHHVTVKGCWIHDVIEVGIQLGGFGISYDNLAYENKVYNCQWNGITLIGNDNTMESNTLWGDIGDIALNPQSGQRFKVIDNTILNMTGTLGSSGDVQYGIKPEASHDGLISGNTVFASRCYADSGSPTTEGNNTITNNIFYTQNATGYSVVYVGTNNNRLGFNTIQPAYLPHEVYGCLQMDGSNNIVIGNLIVPTPSGSICIYDYAINYYFENDLSLRGDSIKIWNGTAQSYYTGSVGKNNINLADSP